MAGGTRHNVTDGNGDAGHPDFALVERRHSESSEDDDEDVDDEGADSGGLSWWSSHEGIGGTQWVSQAAILAPFVLSGTGFTLAVDASKRGDELQYDPASATFCAEAIKLAVCACCLRQRDRAAVTHYLEHWPPPRAWSREALALSVVAASFALQSQMNYLVIQYLGSVLFSLLGNLKIVWTVLFMRLLLGRRFSRLQWLAVAALTVSSAVVKASDILANPGEPMPEDAESHHSAAAALTNSDSHQRSAFVKVLGFGLVMVTTVSSGFAAVYSELILKGGYDDACQPMPFMMKNGILYSWGMLLNFVSWLLLGRHWFFEGFNEMTWVSIVCSAVVGLSVALILGLLDNVVRCFAHVGQVLFTVFFSRLFPARLHQGSFDGFYVLSLVLLAGSLVVYSQHESPELLRHLAVAAVIALLVGLVCQAGA